MAVPTFYIETSVWGSLAPRQPADRKRIVQRLLKSLMAAGVQCVISEVVVAEIQAAPPAITHPLNGWLEKVQPLMVPVTAAADTLAHAYLKASIIPERRQADALHVAVATCWHCTFLVSWNHRHLTRPSNRVQFETVNRAQGFEGSPLICNPLEALHELGHG